MPPNFQIPAEKTCKFLRCDAIIDIIGNRAQECKKCVFAVKEMLTGRQKCPVCLPVSPNTRENEE
jgi:hypothetical protein